MIFVSFLVIWCWRANKPKGGNCSFCGTNSFRITGLVYGIENINTNWVAIIRHARNNTMGNMKSHRSAWNQFRFVETISESDQKSEDILPSTCEETEDIFMCTMSVSVISEISHWLWWCSLYDQGCLPGVVGGREGWGMGMIWFSLCHWPICDQVCKQSFFLFFFFLFFFFF